jgi:hypothetical protein
MRIRTKGGAQHSRSREPRREGDAVGCDVQREEAEERREREAGGRENGQLSVGSPPVLLAGSC